MKRFPFPALAIAALTACASSATNRPPCATSGVCGADGLCVAGVCRPKKEIPTESGTRKLELLPDRWAVVTSQGAQPWNGADIPLGRESEGHVVLLLRFPSPLRETTRVVSAFIVLDPMPGVAPSPSPVPVTLSRVLRPWTQEEASWSRLPELSPVETKLVVSNWGMRPLYIDVTRQVWRWREQRGDEHGLAIVAAPSNALGASYSLGLAGGRGPRLEVYLR
jgi:hypothetical protein